MPSRDPTANLEHMKLAAFLTDDGESSPLPPEAREDRADYLESLKELNEWLARDQLEKACVVNRALPVELVISNTNRCNLRCVMCARQWEPDDVRGKQTIPLDAFRSLADAAFPFARWVSFSAAGEPLCSENIQEELRLVEKYNVALEILTNGTLLGRSELLEPLLRTLRWIKISIDAASKSVFESIRRGGRFEQILENVERFNTARDALPPDRRPRLWFNIVLMKRNIEEFPAWVELAHRYQADCLHANHLLIHDRSLRPESLIFHKELANRYIEAAAEAARQRALPFVFPPLFKLGEGDDTRPLRPRRSVQHRCPYPWTKVWIECDGTVVPCCSPHPRRPHMGSLAESSFSEIWNGPEYQRLRESFRTGKLLEPCRNCYIRVQENSPDASETFLLNEQGPLDSEKPGTQP